MNEQMPPQNLPYKPFFRKKWFWITTIIIIVVVGIIELISNVSKIYPFYCKIQGKQRVHSEQNFHGMCVKFFSDADKDCKQNSECTSQQCLPTIGGPAGNIKIPGLSIDRFDLLPRYDENQILVGYCLRYPGEEALNGTLDHPTTLEEWIKAGQGWRFH